MALAMKHSDRAMEQSATYNMGELERRRPRLDKAKNLFTRSIALARELGDAEEEASSLVALGMVLEDQEDYPSALKSYRSARTRAKDSGEKALEARAVAGLARLQLIAGHFEDAARTYRRAGRLSRDDGGIHHIEILAAVLESLAAGRARTREIERAAQHLVDAGQRERREATASTGMGRSARWLIPSRRSLAIDLYVGAILIEVVGASFRMDRAKDFERYSVALMRPTMLLLHHAKELGDEGELLISDVAKAIQADYPELLSDFEWMVDQSRPFLH
jgi:tetratricopeptide (TPR) repeat protein